MGQGLPLLMSHHMCLKKILRLSSEFVFHKTRVLLSLTTHGFMGSLSRTLMQVMTQDVWRKMCDVIYELSKSSELTTKSHSVHFYKTFCL